MNMPVDRSGAVQSNREKIEQDLLAQIGKQIAKAEQQMAGGNRDLNAARVALEHATLQTALEKDMPTKSVAQMLEKASPSQVADFIKAGKRSIEKTYNIQPEMMVAALSAQVANVDLPKGFAQTEAMKELIDRGRSLANQAVTEQFGERGRFTAGPAGRAGERFDYVDVRTAQGVPTIKDQLKNHMVFVESAVDYAVKAGKMDAQQGQSLKERIEHQVFNIPAEGKMSDQFKSYHQRASQDLRSEVMRDARSVTQNKTVAEIADRLSQARQAVEKLRPAMQKEAHER